MKEIRIEASRTYDVLIGKGLLAEAGKRTAALTGAKRATVVSDDRVYALYGEGLLEALRGAGLVPEVFVFPQGEKQKNRFYQTYRPDRYHILAVGGVGKVFAAYVRD